MPEITSFATIKLMIEKSKCQQKVFKFFRIHLENMERRGLLKTIVDRQGRMDRLLIEPEGEESWGGEVKHQWADVKVGALLPTPLGKLKNPRAIGEQGVLGKMKKLGRIQHTSTCFLPSRK